MDLRVVDLGSLPGVVPARAPAGGFLWDREGRWHRLGPEGLVWTWAPPAPPRWATWGRRVYVALDDTCLCIDTATGEGIWEVGLPGAAVEITASAVGVDVLGRGWLLGIDRLGRVRGEGRLDAPLDQLVRDGTTLWLGGPEGIWRLDADGPPRRFFAGRCRALLARLDGVEALVDTGSPGLLREEGGTPLVWTFPSPDEAVLLPFGDEAWVACDRASGRGLRVMDSRQRVSWSWAEAPVRDVAVVEGCVVVDVVSDEPLLGILRPEGGAVLLLPLPAPVDGLFADGPYLVLTHSDVSTMYHFDTSSEDGS